jgi:hypothetical protein
MKSIANQYRDLKEGKMSQSNFMRNIRMTFPQYITNVTSFKDSVKILKNKGILTENMEPNPVEPDDESLDALIKKIEQEMAGEEAVMGQYDLGEEKEELSEAKLSADQVHPSELRMGIRVELEHTDDVEKAKKIALDHLAENPFYYTALKLSGIESPSKPKEKPVKEKKAKKKDQTELVDKTNQMKKIKMVKENQLNEAGGEYTFNGYFKTAEEKQKLMDIIPDAEIDTDSEEGQSIKTTVTSYTYNGTTIKKAVENALGMSTGRPQSGGEGVAQFMSKLKEMVEEVVNEYYDGRDNLTDIE